MHDLVVKTNRLNTVIQNLSVAEIRLIQIAIVDCRSTNTGLSCDRPLTLPAQRFAEVFSIDESTAYVSLRETAKSIIKKQFRFIDKMGREVESNWVQQCTYGDGHVDILFTQAVVNEITRLDGNERDQIFTKYMLENTALMKSHYSIRLYELLIQWKSATKTPVFEIKTFRGQLGVEKVQYAEMGNFKRRVLDIAVKEINEKSDIIVSYEQVKSGRVIAGFKFVVKLKNKPKKTKSVIDKRDKDTVDMFGAFSMTDKQRQFYGRQLADIHELSNRAKGQSGQCYNAFGRQIADELLQEEHKIFYKPHLAKLGFAFKY